VLPVHLAEYRVSTIALLFLFASPTSLGRIKTLFGENDVQRRDSRFETPRITATFWEGMSGVTFESHSGLEAERWYWMLVALVFQLPLFLMVVFREQI